MTSSTRRTGAAKTPAGPDGRTRRRQERRDRVLAAALELFVERGYDNTTMDEIAERADVARATVFNYFARKSLILEAWALRRRERAMAAVAEDQLVGRGLREILTRYLGELADLNISTRGEAVALVGVSVRLTDVLGRPELGREIADYVRQCGDRARVRADVNADQVGLLLSAGYFVTLTKWISVEPEPFDLRDELLKMVDLMLHGCLTRESD
jgi:AcrR family transcriptional regulator